jgi:3-oxoacyl-[acyl-carrier protein] reductase
VKKGYGRFVYLESASIKQPIENLVLSNTMRMAVAGFVKTISGEMAGKGITFNMLAPGFHETDAVKRIFVNKAKMTGQSAEEIKQGMIKNTPVQKMGDPNDLASLALWLLSPRAGFVTGHVYTLDGGIVKGNL